MNYFSKLIKIFVCLLIIILFYGFLYFDKISLKTGGYFFEKGNFHKSAVCYTMALNYENFQEKLFKKLPFNFRKKQNENNYNLYLKIADCYTESGDIKRAVSLYQKMLSMYKNKDIENESMVNYLEMEIAEGYIKLGYFNEALKIFEKIQSWYPQNLIKIYLYMKEYEKAKELLFSEQIQETIQDGDDIDSATLNYLLMCYFKETKQYDKITEIAEQKDLDFENKLMVKLVLADLYYSLEDYEKSCKLYEELLLSPYLKNTSDFKMKLKYALAAAKAGKQTEAEAVVEDIQKTQKNLYKYAPQKICLKYYVSDVFHRKKELAESKVLLKKLSLKKESFFYDNPEYFCKINTDF